MSPFGMSQGFAGSSVSLASLGSPSVLVSLWGRVSVLLSSTFFVCGCLLRFSPFEVASGFPWVSLSRSGFRFPFWWVPPFSSLFSSVDVSVSSLSFLGVFPRLAASVSVLCSLLVWFCVPALLLSWSVRAAFFLASAFSSLRALHPAFQFFLVWVLAGSYPSLPCSDLSSHRDGAALWDESVALVGSFVVFSRFLVDLCVLLPGSGVVLCPFSLPPPSWASAGSSSLPLICAVFAGVASLGCVRHGSLSSCLGSILCICLSCFCPLCVLYSISGLGAVVFGFSYGFPCDFSFQCSAFLNFHALVCC